VFLRPLAQAFHSGRGAVSLAFTLHNVAVAICIPLAGWLIDRFGARKVILPSMIIVGLLLVSSKLWLASIWQLYAFYLLQGFFGCGAGPLPYSSVVSHWFNRSRGLASESRCPASALERLLCRLRLSTLLAGLGGSLPTEPRERDFRYLQ